MAKSSKTERERKYGHFLQREHTLLGGILVGIDGHLIEIQARATNGFAN
jgi:hypothetical protein